MISNNSDSSKNSVKSNYSGCSSGSDNFQVSQGTFNLPLLQPKHVVNKDLLNSPIALKQEDDIVFYNSDEEFSNSRNKFNSQMDEGVRRHRRRHNSIKLVTDFDAMNNNNYNKNNENNNEDNKEFSLKYKVQKPFLKWRTLNPGDNNLSIIEYMSLTAKEAEVNLDVDLELDLVVDHFAKTLKNSKIN